MQTYTSDEIDVAEKVLKFVIIYCPSRRNYCNFSVFFALTLNVGFIYCCTILIRQSFLVGLTDKSWLISLFRTILSMSMWYMVSFKWRMYYKSIHRLKRLGCSKKSRCVQTILILSVALISVVFPIFFAAIQAYGEKYTDRFLVNYFWLLNNDIQNNYGQRTTIIIMASFTYYAQQFTFPCIFAIVYCTLTWKISEAVSNITKIPKRIVDYEKILQLLEKRRKLVKFSKSFERTFTVVLFWLTWYNLLSIFATFIMSMGLSIQNSLVAISEALIIFVSCSASFIGTVLCATKVSDEFSGLKLNLRNLYQNLLSDFFPQIGNRVLCEKLLKSVIDEEVDYFTLWGFLSINKSLILSAFGAVVTYGVVLVQLKSPS